VAKKISSEMLYKLLFDEIITLEDAGNSSDKKYLGFKKISKTKVLLFGQGSITIFCIIL